MTNNPIMGEKVLPSRVCNRTACRATETPYDNWWWNWSTRAWYCQKCALAINEVGDKVCIIESSLPRSTPAPVGEVAEEIDESCLMDTLNGIAQILDVVKIEWAEAWTPFDQDMRDRLTKHLKVLYAGAGK